MRCGLATSWSSALVGAWLALVLSAWPCAAQLGAVELSVATAFRDQAFEAAAVLDTSALPLGATVVWRAAVDGEVQQSGSVVVERAASKVVAGVVASALGGARVTLSVEMPDGTSGSSSAEVQVIEPGVSLIPLLLVLVMAATTQMVEVSLASGVFVGAWIVTGSASLAFQRFLDTYLVQTVANADHQFVILFTLFLSGLVGMVEKSGGILGMTKVLLRYAKGTRAAQCVAIAAGMLIFFDDYASCLVVGFSFRPVFDPLMISREKLAFITDATSAPIASLSPLSSWVGFEIGLIQQELNNIKALNGTMPEGLSGSGFTVFVQSVPYRYYPIFMLVLQFTLALMRYELGPMMAAERKVTVYRRTDGGDGAFVGNKQSQANEPHALTPQRWWNMVLPLTLLVALIIASMVDLGIKSNAAAEPPNLSPSIGEIFEATNPYASLLYGTFAAALLTALFFALQHHADGKVTRPSPRGCLRASAPAPRDKRDVAQLAAEARPLLSIRESSNAFLFGIQRVFPAVVVLVLAWAIGMVQKDVGCNRFFQSYIEQNISSTSLPSVVFIFSSFMALATGTSWGTMTIVFPIVVVPAWTVSGDPTVVIATVAAVLSGAVMGDHCSPISDTTVLSALASDCNLMKHVWTQLPYSIMTFVWCLLLGTIPVAAGAYPTGVATLLAIVCIPLTMLILGAPIVNKTGRFDLLTEFYLVVRAKVIKRPDEELEQLRSDTAAFYANGSSAVDTELLKQDDAPNAESA